MTLEHLLSLQNAPDQQDALTHQGYGGVLWFGWEQGLVCVNN